MNLTNAYQAEEQIMEQFLKLGETLGGQWTQREL